MCLLVEAFYPLTFKVTIDIYVFIAILLIVFVFVGLFPPCDLMTVLVFCLNSILFLAYISIMHFWFAVTMKFLYSSLF